MKNNLLLFTLLFFSANSFAQTKAPCIGLQANLKKGTLNKLKPTASMADIKAKLPCFTGDTEEGSSFNCGGGVFYLKNDFFFYSGRDYIEFRKKFNGKLSIDLLGKTREEIVKILGEPARKDTEGSEEAYLFKKKYGSLRVSFGSDEKVRVVAIHAQQPADVKLCY